MIAHPDRPTTWRSPEELVAIGFERSRVVMMNEAHSMLLRSVRTRELGRRILPTAHESGARHLAMEALVPDFTQTCNATRHIPEVQGGYLAQPDMRSLIAAALELGWMLIAYEIRVAWPPGIPHQGVEGANFRDDHQARNLVEALGGLTADTPLLVWCGNSHLSRRSSMAGDRWVCASSPCQASTPSRSIRREVSSSRVVPLPRRRGSPPTRTRSTHWGGAAGFLAEEAPDGWFTAGSADAFVISTDNAMR